MSLPPTILELAQRYYLARADELGRSSRLRIDRSLFFLCRRLSDRTAESIARVDIAALWPDLIADGRARATAVLYMASIKAAFDWWADQGLIPDAVAASVRAFNAPRGPAAGKPSQIVRAPLQTDIDTLLAFLESTPPGLSPWSRRRRRELAAMIRIETLTGIRGGELCSMRGCEIDRVISLDGQPVWTFAPARHKNAWRGQTARRFIGPRAQELFVRACPWLSEEPNRPVFGWTPSQYRSRLRVACRRAGISPINPHQLRHHRGESLERAGIDRRTIGSVLGHGRSSEQVTERYTTGIDPAAAAVVQKMG